MIIKRRFRGQTSLPREQPGGYHRETVKEPIGVGEERSQDRERVKKLRKESARGRGGTRVQREDRGYQQNQGVFCEESGALKPSSN